MSASNDKDANAANNSSDKTAETAETPELKPSYGPEDNKLPRGALICLIIGLASFAAFAGPQRIDRAEEQLTATGFLANKYWADQAEVSEFTLSSSKGLNKLRWTLSADLQRNEALPDAGKLVMRSKIYQCQQVGQDLEVKQQQSSFSRNSPERLLRFYSQQTGPASASYFKVEREFTNTLELHFGRAGQDLKSRTRSALTSLGQLLTLLRDRTRQLKKLDKQNFDFEFIEPDNNHMHHTRWSHRSKVETVGEARRSFQGKPMDCVEWLVKIDETRHLRVWVSRDMSHKVVGFRDYSGQDWQLSGYRLQQR